MLITGAARGMGLLYARRAVAAGATAVVLWDVDAAQLAEVATELITREFLPLRAWDFVAGRIFRTYNSMDEFTGR